MFIIDDILMAPAKGLMWIFREIHAAAQEELEGEHERITAQLSELYMMLDAGRITEAEFDIQEKNLLDRLEELNTKPDEEPMVVRKINKFRENDLNR